MTFGAALRSNWLLDPQVSYLNHGTVGAPPKVVLEAQQRMRDEIERQPARFLLRELADITGEGDPPRPRMRVAAEAVAAFVGARAEDFGFVDNITTGANAVLRSFPFRAGDEIVVTSLGYQAVTNTASYVARNVGATVRTIDVPGPGAPAETYAELIVGGLGPATRMLVVDHITAETALVLPLAEIAAACHERGVVVLADGAHVPGAIELDVPALGVDFYVANLHKWAWTPRSAGFVWAAPEHHEHLHPAVISWGLDHGLAAEFDLVGTRDPSPFLCAPTALEVMASYGTTDVFRYNHELAWWAGQYLADRWGTSFTTPEEMIGTMVNVTLPAAAGSTPEDAKRWKDQLLFEHDVEVPIFCHGDRLTTRVSAQIYVDRAEIERFADLVIAGS